MLYALFAASLVGLSPQATSTPATELAKPALPGFHLVAATARVDYFAMSDSSAKVDDARKVEQMLEAIERRMGQRGPGRLSYYRVSYVADMQRLTGRPLLGVTDAQGRRIISCVAVHAHEIVHSVAISMGEPGRFFDEGLAVALSGEPEWKSKRLHQGAKAGLEKRALPRYLADFDGAAPDDAYAVAGAFVEHLIAQHGLAKVLEFVRGCETCPRDEMFQRTFGVTVADAGAAWSTQLRNN